MWAVFAAPAGGAAEVDELVVLDGVADGDVEITGLQLSRELLPNVCGHAESGAGRLVHLLIGGAQAERELESVQPGAEQIRDHIPKRIVDLRKNVVDPGMHVVDVGTVGKERQAVVHASKYGEVHFGVNDVAGSSDVLGELRRQRSGFEWIELFVELERVSNRDVRGKQGRIDVDLREMHSRKARSRIVAVNFGKIVRHTGASGRGSWRRRIRSARCIRVRRKELLLELGQTRIELIT